MVRNVGTCIQRNGQAGGGGVRTHGIVSEGPQKQPGQQTDVGDTLDEFFRSVEKKEVFKVILWSVSLGAQQMHMEGRDQKRGLVGSYIK